jgi:hypothetical protein
VPTDPPTGGGEKRISVPDVRGQTETAARRKLHERLLVAAVSARKHAPKRRGVVLSQSRRNAKVKKGTQIRLVVSLGPKKGASGSSGGDATTTGTSTSGGTTGGTTTGEATTRCYDRLGRLIPCGAGGGTDTGGGGGGGGGGEDHKTCVDRYGRKYPC